jgi:hypothetical protein
VHPYEVPEIVALEAAAIAPSYLAWLLGATAEAAGNEGKGSAELGERL